jgi:DNA-binding transcriptional regulator YiaG
MVATRRRIHDLKGLPGRIAAIRSRLDLSQGHFAARVGVSRNIVIRYEGRAGSLPGRHP